MFLGQAEQDKFVAHLLKHKTNGYFLEIGSNHPIHNNNTYILEKNYNWKGVMVEYDRSFLDSYKSHRPNSIHIIDDATNVNYKDIFQSNQFPPSLDYLQIDLEVNNGSTLKTLQKLNNEIFNNYKFATVTFEHDIYHTNFANTREESRKIFKQNGYVCVFEDINNQDIHPFEDWYVHPELVDMNYVASLIEKNKRNYKTHPITGVSINWKDISYV